jgi:hypothetical protein
MDDRRDASRAGVANDLAGAIQKGWETFSVAGIGGAPERGAPSDEGLRQTRGGQPHGPAAEELLRLFESWLRQQPDMERDFLELVYVSGVSAEEAAARVAAAPARAVRSPPLSHRRAALETRVVRALNSFRRVAVDWLEHRRRSHGGDAP